MGRSSSRARRSASSSHGYQSTGLSLCWSRYGLVSFASLLAILSLPYAPERGFRRGPLTYHRIARQQLSTPPGEAWRLIGRLAKPRTREKVLLWGDLRRQAFD